MMIFSKLKEYLVALLGALASALAVLYFRKEALFQKEKAKQAERAAESSQAAVNSMREQSKDIREKQAQQADERDNAVKSDTYLDYFE